MFKRSLLTTAILAGMVATSAHALTSTVSGSATYGTTTATANNGNRVVSTPITAMDGSLAAFNTDNGVLTSVTLSAAYGSTNFFTMSRSGNNATGTADSSETFQLKSGSSTVKTWTGASSTSILGSSTPSLLGGGASFTDVSTLALFTGANLVVSGSASVGATKSSGGGTVTATLNKYMLPEKIEAKQGTNVTTVAYSDYGEWNDDAKADVYLPKRMVVTQNGQTSLDLTLVHTNTYNPYVIMPVPENVRGARTN